MPEFVVDYAKYKAVQTALQASFQKQLDNEFYNYSSLWEGFIQRRDTSGDLSDFLISFHEKANSTEGIAGTLPESKRALFVEYYKTFVSSDLLERYPMSWLGAPTVLDFEGRAVNMTYLENLRLFTELQEMLSGAESLADKPLHIVEIGAGHGGLANFLLRSGKVASYTIVDLPENLKISAFYLSQTFSDLKWGVVPSPEPLPLEARQNLHFVAPGNLAALADWRFDLAINSDSLGEMPADTAKAYVKWIHEHLVEGGYLFTKNGHNRSRDCVPLPSDYGYQAFRFQELKPPTGISSLFDDFSHFGFLQKTSRQVTPGRDSDLNALCALYAIGVQDELREISKAYAHGKMDSQQERFLRVCDRVFSSKSLKKKAALLEAEHFEGPLEACRHYLLGIIWYLIGDRKRALAAVDSYLPQSQSYIGEAYATMIRARKDPSALQTQFKHGSRTRFALDEIYRMSEFKAPFREIAFRLRADVLRKKIQYPSNYSPSALLKTKNVLFNLREGRGLSTTR